MYRSYRSAKCTPTSTFIFWHEGLIETLAVSCPRKSTPPALGAKSYLKKMHLTHGWVWYSSSKKRGCLFCWATSSFQGPARDSERKIVGMHCVLSPVQRAPTESRRSSDNLTSCRGKLSQLHSGLLNVVVLLKRTVCPIPCTTKRNVGGVLQMKKFCRLENLTDFVCSPYYKIACCLCENITRTRGLGVSV